MQLGHRLSTVSNPKAQRESMNSVLCGDSLPGQVPSVGCFPHIHRRAPEKSCHQLTSFSCILLVRMGHCQGMLPAWGWKRSIYQKNGQKLVGPPWMQWTCLYSQHPDGKAQLPSRGFYRKGLNRHLSRQMKPALEPALET